MQVLELTLNSILKVNYDHKKIILVFAYEERGGEAIENNVHRLIEESRGKFLHTMAVKHPMDIPNEMIGKGGNITYAGRALKHYLKNNSLIPLRVIVTTLDADNHPHKWYFSVLSYVYCLCQDPTKDLFSTYPGLYKQYLGCTSANARGSHRQHFLEFSFNLTAAYVS